MVFCGVGASSASSMKSHSRAPMASLGKESNFPALANDANSPLSSSSSIRSDKPPKGKVRIPSGGLTSDVTAQEKQPDDARLASTQTTTSNCFDSAPLMHVIKQRRRDGPKMLPTYLDDKEAYGLPFARRVIKTRKEVPEPPLDRTSLFLLLLHARVRLSAAATTEITDCGTIASLSSVKRTH